MSYTQKVLSFTFAGAQSGSFTASGLRAWVSIQRQRGRLGVQGQVKIWGLSDAQMNAYSSRIPTAASALSPLTLTIAAGDLGGALTEVANAVIWESFIDLSGAPESAFVVAVAGIYTASNAMAAQSQPGAQNAEDLIAAICASAGFTLKNNGAHAVLRNQATYGSALDQIETIAQAAGFAWSWSNKTFAIWPGEVEGTIDDTIVQVGPGTTPQMVGYPQYWPQGLIITSLFNPEVQVGRQMEVVGSLLTKANGLWQIVGAQDDLSTMIENGPWFTTATLAAAA